MAVLTNSENKVVLRVAAGEIANGLVLIFDQGTKLPQDLLDSLGATSRPHPSESDFAAAMRRVEAEVYGPL